MNEQIGFRLTYDDTSDVLYLKLKAEPASKGEEDADGVVWRYNRTGDLIGVTIVDFAELWRGKTHDLAVAIGRKSTVDPEAADRALAGAMKAEGSFRLS